MMMPAKADHANLSMYQASHDQLRQQLRDAARASHPDALGSVARQHTATSDEDSRRVRIRSLASRAFAQRVPLWARIAGGDGR